MIADGLYLLIMATSSIWITALCMFLAVEVENYRVLSMLDLTTPFA